MIEWKQCEAGKYESEDGRWKIEKGWDPIWNNCWLIHDSHVPDETYHGETLRAAKAKVEAFLREEEYDAAHMEEA